MHRSIVCVDVENFCDARRTDPDQAAVRAGMYGALRRALAASGVSWDNCYREDRGDGVLVLVPPAVPKSHLVTGFPPELAAALTVHNRAHGPQARIRLRAALHAGEIRFDDHGVVGRSINLAFRLLEADAVKSALRGSRGVLALIASDWFFHEVIRQEPAAAPEAYNAVRITVKETVAEAWIRLPDHLDAAPGEAAAGPRSRREPEPAVSVPRQLPGAVRDFVGRERELAALTGLLDESAARGPAAAVAVITGTAGVGKTALVVHWARTVRDRFPDGELYVNLRGYGSDPPIPAEQGLDRMLRTLDVAAEKIPAGVEAKAALYRSLLAGRRLLVVLDNAADVKQVRPLLPGTPGCVVVVTSRDRMPGLVVRDGARSVGLDRLGEDEAVALLRQVIGAAQVDAEPEAAAKIALRCDFLPLALRVAAERAAVPPRSALADVADELAGEQNRLDILETDDDATALRTAFSWSYRALPLPAAHVFRLLGLHRGPDISLDAVAALIDNTPAAARPVLKLLTGKHLLEETVKDRFWLHDLLRCYAEECAREQETEQERANAVRRLLVWYLHTAENARRRCNSPSSVSLAVADVPRRARIFTTCNEAQEWCETERLNLIAAIRHAGEAGHHDIAWRLSVALTGFFHHRKYLADWLVVLEIGLTSARFLGDRNGEGYVLNCFGFAHHDHQHEKAFKHYRQALVIFRETGDRPGLGIAIHGIAHAVRGLRLFKESVGYYQEALAIFHDTENRVFQGVALFGLGFAYVGIRQFERAIDCFQRVFDFVDEDRRTEGWALHGLGYGYRGLHRFDESIECYQQALTVFREIGDWWGQGEALYNLGKALADVGRPEMARQYWTEALAVFRELNDPREAEVRARLE